MWSSAWMAGILGQRVTEWWGRQVTPGQWTPLLVLWSVLATVVILAWFVLALPILLPALVTVGLAGLALPARLVEALAGPVLRLLT